MSSSIYFDIVGGASGDMLLSSLLSLGVPAGYLQKNLGTLKLPARLKREKASFGHATVEKVWFSYSEGANLSFNEIVATVKKSRLPADIISKTLASYKTIAAIERKIHKTPEKNFRFHHLGEPDAILEIAGFYLGLAYLGVDAMHVSSFPLSNPAPATLALLQGKNIRLCNLAYESITPTAALLLKDAVFCERPFSYKNFAYACGNFGSDDYLVAYLSAETVYEHDTVVQIETTIDDMNPQAFEPLLDTLYAHGAKEVYIQQVIAKKSRPAFVATVLSGEDTAAKIKEILISHTTTFGLRYQYFQRDKLKTSFISKKTKWGKVNFRISQSPGITKEVPEYEDCKRIAKKFNIPLIEVYSALS